MPQQPFTCNLSETDVATVSNSCVRRCPITAKPAKVHESTLLEILSTPKLLSHCAAQRVNALWHANKSSISTAIKT